MAHAPRCVRQLILIGNAELRQLVFKASGGRESLRGCQGNQVEIKSLPFVKHLEERRLVDTVSEKIVAPISQPDPAVCPRNVSQILGMVDDKTHLFRREAEE